MTQPPYGSVPAATPWHWNPAPGWPAAPQGWSPPPGWQPDASWPPAPPDWQFWLPSAPAVPAPPAPPQLVPSTPLPQSFVVGEPAIERWYRKRGWQLAGAVVGLLLLFAVLKPEDKRQPSQVFVPDPDPVVETTAEAPPAFVAPPPVTSPPVVVRRTTARPIAPPPAPAARTDPRFGTCREAKANDYGPYRQGTDPEYDWYRDADNDGVVCE